ncbi:MAG TPA: ATP-binding protein [Gemmatimonadales bacterium]|nr:ATP-binding protein [Gemmatimonadales bacterium]
MRVVTIPSHLDDRSLDQVAAHLGTWPPEQRILVDAHATEWASPVGFTALLTLGQALQEAGAPTPRLTLPASDSVTSYWARAGFIGHAEPLFELHGKVPRRKADEQSDVLLPITPIREARDVHTVVEHVTDRATRILREELELEPTVVGGFGQSLSETCQNVVEHAGAGGWVAVHVYNFKRRLGRRAAVISVSDAGIGFRMSLEATQAKRYGDRWGDGMAIETALIHNISRFRDPGRGQGLAGTKRYLARWQGKITIRSGTARVGIIPAWDDEPPMTQGLAWFPGSQVTIVIPGKATDR